MPTVHLVPFPRHILVLQILLKARYTVNHATRSNLDDPVGHGGDELVVVGGEQHHLGIGDQAVVQGGKRLQVQVVGRLVQDQGVGAGEHHPGQHAAHPLAARQDAGLLQWLPHRRRASVPGSRGQRSPPRWGANTGRAIRSGSGHSRKRHRFPWGNRTW